MSIALHWWPFPPPEELNRTCDLDVVRRWVGDTADEQRVPADDPLDSGDQAPK